MTLIFKLASFNSFKAVSVKAEPFAIQKPGFSEEAGLLGPNVITPRSDCKFVGQAVLAETPYERHEAEFVSVLLLCGRHSLPYMS